MEKLAMNLRFTLASAAVGAALILGATALASPVMAADQRIDRFVNGPAPRFADPEAAVAAFKTALAANDFEGLAKLLGLDAGKARNADGITERFTEIRAAAAKLTAMSGDGDQRIVSVGDQVWPFPFPIRKGKDGKWAFDTQAGLEEVVNRRVGENELQAIATARAYVDVQKEYASEDRDGDGVLEYAQKLVSTEGQTDGLYWPPEQGDGESLAGAYLAQAALDKAKAGEGYFGYRFRVLRGQGSNIAGGRYDYVINGNMIAGFALIATPAKYGLTGVSTFVVNHAGIVYEKDLGPDTEAIAEAVVRFNPDKTWNVVND